MVYSLEALGTKLALHSMDKSFTQGLVHFCFEEVKRFEKKFSRFDSHSSLSRINQQGEWVIDEEFLKLLRLSKEVHENSFGYFDITVCNTLESIGYGKHWEVRNPDVSFKDIEFRGNHITLMNGAKIDFGWIWKGYIIDVLFEILSSTVSEFIIDFGWDIRVKWEHTIGLEDPYDNSKIIGEILLENMSLSGSSWQKRRFWSQHHLINPKTKESPDEILSVFVLHSLACISDMYATTLFVAPLEISLEILERTSWLEGLVITKQGEIYQSHWFQCTLY